MNDGPLCRCSIKSRRSGIRHNIYPGEHVSTHRNMLLLILLNLDKARVMARLMFTTSMPLECPQECIGIYVAGISSLQQELQ